MKPLIRFEDVSLGYGRRVVVENLTMTVAEGDFLGIIGPNGCGKTTILRGMLGFIPPRRGRIVREPALSAGYCVQRQFLDTVFPFRVDEAVMMGRIPLMKGIGAPSERDHAKVCESLDFCGIRSLERNLLSEVSGGEKQRVLLARALVREPRLLVLDEPTTDLDIRGRNEILSLVERIRGEKNLTVVLVSHELETVLNRAEKFLFKGNHSGCVLLDRAELTEERLSAIFSTPVRLRRMEGRWVIV